MIMIVLFIYDQWIEPDRISGLPLVSVGTRTSMKVPACSPDLLGMHLISIHNLLVFLRSFKMMINDGVNSNQ